MIQVENLKKTYDKTSRHAHEVLHGMSFTLPDKGFVCILGPSGCGKTSLLNAIGGLDLFDSGIITTENTRITRSGSRKMEKERNANFGYIFQNYYLLSEHSAAYNVYLGMHSMSLSKKEKMKRVKNALEKVDMLRYRKRPVGQLSGGQQQRIAIARAIAKNPKVIFADEPTGNLDEANTLNICSILKNLSKESLVVMVTHEEHIANFFADRIITLEDGKIISDMTDWERGTLSAGEKGAVYSHEYEESTANTEQVSLRILHQKDASPVQLTVIAEADRIIIKTNDNRVVLCSAQNDAPLLIEGERPVLSSKSFTGTEQTPPKKETDDSARGKRGLGFRFLLKEAKSLVSSRRLSQVGMLIFVVLLSVMLSISVADIITASHINPENFIKTDSHVLKLKFGRGENLPREELDYKKYIAQYMEKMSEVVDFDYVAEPGRYFLYQDDTVPQFGELSIKMQGANYANINRLNPSALIAGRMPQRFDEIVVDRWLLDKYLSTDGILQNIVPGREYFLDKTLISSNKSGFMPTIVGICDSGEPTMYLSTELLFIQTAGGMETMSFTEFCEVTGYDKLDKLEADECIVLADNAGVAFTNRIGQKYPLGQLGNMFLIKDAPTKVGHNITIKYVFSDETIEKLYRETITAYSEFVIWCENKEDVLNYLYNSTPKELEGLLDIQYQDTYSQNYQEYQEKATIKADAKTIVTATVFLLSLVMLYLMQRSKINEHMDLIAVYRLLGVPKPSVLLIFAAESVATTLKFALPSVFLSWVAINLFSQMDAVDFYMLFPIEAAGLTLLAILAIRLIYSVLPVLRLLYQPPARLAAKHDF